MQHRPPILDVDAIQKDTGQSASRGTGLSGLHLVQNGVGQGRD